MAEEKNEQAEKGTKQETTGGVAEPVGKKPRKVEMMKPSDTAIRNIPLWHIKSNKSNKRDPLPHLSGLGYGLFERIADSGKPSLTELAFSDKPEDRQLFKKLVEEHESGDTANDDDRAGGTEFGIKEFAENILMNGVMHSLTVRPMEGGDGYDLIAGSRRYIALLYTQATTGTEVKAVCRIVERNDTDSTFMSFSENAFRKDMNRMEEAMWINQMRNLGKGWPEIAKQLGMSDVNARQIAKLTKLPENLQKKVANRTMPVSKALKILKGDLDPSNPKATSRGRRGDGGNVRIPSRKWFVSVYDGSDKLADEADQMTAREFIAKYLLHVNLRPLDELREMAKVIQGQDGEGKGRGKGRSGGRKGRK